MSETSQGGEAPYENWQQAALGGNLLSYAWQHRPSMQDIVPGYDPNENVGQKILDWASVPARVGTSLALGPAIEGGKALQNWMAGDQSPEVQHQLTSAMVGLGARGLGLEAPGPASFAAWHGSRHLFEQFKDEAIGSGEGAQAYGWGHYVAGSPKTAETYKTAGAENKVSLTFDGKQISLSRLDADSEGINMYYGFNALIDNEGNFQEAAKSLKNQAQRLYHAALNIVPDEQVPETRRRLLLERASENMQGARWLEENKQRIGYEPPPQGHLYSVHVVPEEHEFLDWEKPLHEQSPQVQQIVKQNNFHTESRSGEWTGEEIYRGLERRAGDPQWASEALHNAGIPGVRYRDAGSRNLPEGHPDVTHNYVIFHPSNLRIVGRDGQHWGLEPVEHDPFEGTKLP